MDVQVKTKQNPKPPLQCCDCIHLEKELCLAHLIERNQHSEHLGNELSLCLWTDHSGPKKAFLLSWRECLWGPKFELELLNNSKEGKPLITRNKAKGKRKDQLSSWKYAVLCGCTIASHMLWKDLGVEVMPADQQANSSVKKINSCLCTQFFKYLGWGYSRGNLFLIRY